MTVVSPLADLYVDALARDAGLAEDLASFCKVDKYSVSDSTFLSVYHCWIFMSHEHSSVLIKPLFTLSIVRCTT